MYTFIESPKQANAFGLYRDGQPIAIIEFLAGVDGAEVTRQLTSAAPDQPCGHPRDSIVASDEGTHYCAECAKLLAGEPFY